MRTDAVQQLVVMGEAGDIGAVDCWGLCFFSDSKLTSVPSALLITIALCCRVASGTISRVSALRWAPGPDEVAGVEGGEDMLMLLEG